jgi:uncharacterized membrane protein
MKPASGRLRGATPIPWWVTVGSAAAVLATALVLGAQHDHAEYLVQWSAILAGEDPAGMNAYGPLHNLFAAPFALWALLPKLLFAGCAVGASWLLIRQRAVGGPTTDSVHWGVVLAAFLLNPLVIGTIYVQGQNDIVSAFLVVLAFVARDRGRPGAAGMFIGIAAAQKFYPLAFAGFLMLEGKQEVNLKVGVSAVGTFVVGMVVSYLAWGPSTFEPLLYGAGRDAKILSIYRFLSCHPALVGGDGPLTVLLETNTWVVLGIATAALGTLHLIGAGWRTASALGLLMVLAAYKVGHPQFYVTWLVPFAWLLVDDTDPVHTTLARALAPVAVLLAIVQVAYGPTGAMLGEWAWLRCYISIPFLSVVAISLVMGFRVIWQPIRPGFRLRW